MQKKNYKLSIEFYYYLRTFPDQLWYLVVRKYAAVFWVWPCVGGKWLTFRARACEKVDEKCFA